MTDPRTDAAANAYRWAIEAQQADEAHRAITAEKETLRQSGPPYPGWEELEDRSSLAWKTHTEARAMANMWAAVAAVQPTGGQCPIAARSEIPGYPEVSICCHPAGHSGAHGTSHDDERGLHVWADDSPAAYDFTIIQPEEQP